MTAQPTNFRPQEQLPSLPQRPRERLAGGMIRTVTRVVGLRPQMVPDHMRRQLRMIGVTDEQVDRVLGRLRSLSAWPYAWESEGDARAAVGDWPGAFAAWYVAQRILIAPSPLKHRLYRMAVEAYEHVEQPPLERIWVPNARGERIAGYLQLPRGARADEPVPCVLMVPGITGTKEELHPYCMPLLRRGIAIARIDNPVYGETEGLLDGISVANARPVLEHLARDPRLDPDALHLHGMSLGANFALRAAAGSRAASVTVICPPFIPERYFRELPTLNLTALQHMTRRRDVDDLVRFAEENSLEQLAPQLTMPVRIFHGGRDRTVPVGDGQALARAVAGPSALTIYERDHHNCLEHADEITALTLEMVFDPYGTCERHAAVERVDATPSQHVTDEAALLASAGFDAPRRAARLPFALPRLRARAGTAASR